MSRFDGNKKGERRSARRSAGIVILTASAILACSLPLWAKPDDAVDYPAGFRHWTHVKSTIIGPKSPNYEKIGGVQHIYANEKGMEGYLSGRFPEGSVLVYDFLETKELTTPPGVIVEGPRRFTSVMVRDSKRFGATGGWGFEEFRGDSQTDRIAGANAATMCFACHEQQKDREYVFSKYRK
ncbi:MAG TPA: cytochrome P460 family protein [Blastocatellia bacterium]|nr:cytochrome P460 family protein [Blastocatellia bacterium]